MYKNFSYFCLGFKNNKSMKKRTDEEWRKLHEDTAAQIIAAQVANFSYDNYSQESMVFVAVTTADTFIEELKKREEKELEQTTSEQ